MIEAKNSMLIFIARSDNVAEKFTLDIPKKITFLYDDVKKKYQLHAGINITKCETDFRKHKYAEVYVTISDDPNAHHYPCGGLSLGYSTFLFSVFNATVADTDELIFETDRPENLILKNFMPIRHPDDFDPNIPYRATKTMIEHIPTRDDYTQINYFFSKPITNVLSTLTVCHNIEKNVYLLSTMSYKPTSCYNSCKIQAFQGTKEEIEYKMEQLYTEEDGDING